MSYGLQDISILSSNFICKTFQCSQAVDTSNRKPGSPELSTPATLPHFIAHVLFTTSATPAVAFAALAYLARLKKAYPKASSQSGNRLFFAAFLIAHKFISDVEHGNRQYTEAAVQGLIPLREVNQLVREMCQYLDWKFFIVERDLRDIEAEVWRASGKQPQALSMEKCMPDAWTMELSRQKAKLNSYGAVMQLVPVVMF
jgi:hypothetical protein